MAKVRIDSDESHIRLRLKRALPKVAKMHFHADLGPNG